MLSGEMRRASHTHIAHAKSHSSDDNEANDTRNLQHTQQYKLATRHFAACESSTSITQ